jgi:hypothetical protein
MIAALLVVAGLVLVVVPGLFVPSARIAAAESARLAASALLVGFVAVELGLTLLAFPTVLRGLHAAGFASICERVLTPLAPGGDLVGWLAAAAAIVVGGRAWHAGRRAYRDACAAEVEPWLGRHEDRGDFDLVVLPTARWLAMSVPGTQPQVLISDGLVAHLDAEELDAVIRHEAMHHRFRHWRYSLLSISVQRALSPIPLVGRSTRALQTALEEWADEAAAGDSTSRRALVRRAIVAVGGPIDDVSSPGASRDVLRRRTGRLEQMPRPTAWPVRLAIHAPFLVLGITAVALLGSWAIGAHHAAGFAGYCPD